MQNNSVNSPAVYAGFWVRAAAYLIDSFIVFAGLLAVRLMFAAASLFYEGPLFGDNLLFHYSLKDIVLYVCHAAYFISCTYLSGFTLGKKAMNIRVINADGRVRLKLLNVIYRETIGRFLSAFILGIGYIAAGIDGEKRAVHDRLCDTRVIYAKKVKVFPVYRQNTPNQMNYHKPPDLNLRV